MLKRRDKGVRKRREGRGGEGEGEEKGTLWKIIMWRELGLSTKISLSKPTEREEGGVRGEERKKMREGKRTWGTVNIHTEVLVHTDRPFPHFFLFFFFFFCKKVRMRSIFI